MLLFQVFVVSILCWFFFYFLGMSKVQTPSPHASKKHDKRCDSCQAYVSELDPHPVCLKCVPRECSKELPCSHCASLSPDAWKKWERQQASRRSSSSTKGPKGDSAKGGANLGRQRPLRGIAQMLLQPPKPSLLVGRDWQPWNQAFRPSGRKWPPCLPVSRDASRRPIPQVPKPTSPVIATGVLAVERSFPKSHLLASSPVGGCWARRPCHLLVGPPGVTRVIPAT